MESRDPFSAAAGTEGESTQPGVHKPKRREPKQKTGRKSILERRQAPDGYLTADQLISQAGITRGQLRAMCARGEVLSDASNGTNWALYKQEWVSRILELKERSKKWHKKVEPKYSPAIRRMKVPYSIPDGQLVMRLFRDGMNAAEIALTHAIHPTVIFTILRDYALLTGGIYIPGDAMEVINKTPLDGVFPITTAGGIVELIATASHELECQKCKIKRRSRMCRGCLGIDQTAPVKPDTVTSPAETTAGADSAPSGNATL